MTSDLHESQLTDTQAVLMEPSDDSLLKPLRQISGMPAPGEDLGGWCHYDPDYDYRKDFDDGVRSGVPLWAVGVDVGRLCDYWRRGDAPKGAAAEPAVCRNYHRDTHHNFETSCGSYAHFKRYLLRVTHDARYGDSVAMVQATDLRDLQDLSSLRPQHDSSRRDSPWLTTGEFVNSDSNRNNF